MPKPSSRRAVSKQPSPVSSTVTLFPIHSLPEIEKGDDLATLIALGAERIGIQFEKNDVIVIAQKVVSKAEGCVVQLSSVKPSPEARRLAAILKKDPKFVEVVLEQSRRIVRSDPVLIVETHHGFVCANAGVDRSNVPGRDSVTLLPKDPDQSAQKLVASLKKRTGKRIAVIISDTFGRPWRLGLTNIAIGAAGVPVLRDLRGQRDRNGKFLHATILAAADELAAAAGLVMGKAEGIPMVLIRGYRYRHVADSAARIIRPANEDLFR
jgi:coenzyme F420-0:L-glutamate ligase/coenzyme F420-1:gamma-L-glutamate ligase